MPAISGPEGLATGLMDDLINDFIAETREMLDALGGEIVAWEAAPHDRARLDSIFRFVHTVKGNCGFFDLPRLRALSHAAEDALAGVRAGLRVADHRLVSAVLAVIDRIAELVQALETGESLASDDDEPLIAALAADAAAPEPATAEAAIPAQRAAVRTIRLPVDLLDRMMNGISDLVLARNELARRLRDSAAGAEAGAAFERVSATIAEMRDAITRTRMQRIDNLFAPLPRMVRDLAAETGKQVTLETDGGDVELDREMIEMIRDPLTHIIRNAIDHGIEDPESRLAAGKREAGTLEVLARQAGNQILIEVADDGRGIDGDGLAARAVAAGLLGPKQAARLSLARRTALIFEPGLSTAAEVTPISGRGVGMDVVRANIERIGGLVEVDSRTGEGVRFTLRVPMTLTIIPALTVAAGNQSFAIPRSAIEEIVRLRGGAARVERVGDLGVATVRGRRVPLVDLADILGAAAGAESGEASLILLKTSAGAAYALAVEQVHDHEELVVKPAAPAVMATGLYAGTTLADDGKPVLVLDPAGIARRGGISLDRVEQEAATAGPADRADEAPHLLFRSFSGAGRAVPLAAVERIEEVATTGIQLSAGRLHVSLGDEILPLLGCADLPSAERIRVLRLTDGVVRIAYAVGQVVDIVSIGSMLAPAAAPGEVRGVAMVAGEQVELLDLYWLFAGHAARPAADRPVCVIPKADPWMNAILRPIVESAGYRVCHPDDPGADEAEVAILGADGEASLAAPPCRVVRIRAEAEAEGKADGTIHRYDRGALLRALAGPARPRRKKG
jgi:two-component system chemotaxis sensor kinase CheA